MCSSDLINPLNLFIQILNDLLLFGDNLKFSVDLIVPIAMEEKLRFAIREGGRTVGAGVVSKIIE